MGAAPDQPDPAWDPDVRYRVQRALDMVLFAARDILLRYGDPDGFYQSPSEVAEGGDVTGLIAVGNEQLVRRLQAQLDETRAAMRRALAEVDDYKRQKYGPGYWPTPRPDGLDAPPPGGRPGGGF